MKFKNTGLLLLLLVALAAYVYFVEIKGKEKAEKQKEIASKLLSFNKDSLSTVVLNPAGIKFKKENKQWVIVEPIQSKTESWVINGLINSVESAKKERTIAEDQASFADYGLQPAKHEVILTHNGKTDTVFIGDKTPTGTYVFARVSGDNHVYATGTLLLTNADKELFDFRDKTALAFDKDKVDKIQLILPERKIEVRKQDGKWYLMRRTQKILADEGKIEQILNEVHNAKAKKFVSEKPERLKKYGLSPAKYEVALSTTTNGGIHTLQIGKKVDNTYYARDVSRDPIFTVDTSLVKQLKVSEWDLRQKKLADFLSYQADYLELHLPKQTLICEKDSTGDWRMVQPDSGKAKSWKISSLTSNAASLKAQKVVEEKPKSLKKYGLDPPQYQIICKKEGKTIADIKIGKQIGKNYYATGDLSPAVYLIKKEDVDKFNIQFKDLLEEKSEKE